MEVKVEGLAEVGGGGEREGRARRGMEERVCIDKQSPPQEKYLGNERLGRSQHGITSQRTY